MAAKPLSLQSAAAREILPGADPFQPQWFAVYTRARHEKKIADQLERKQLQHFLPLYDAVHRWRDRNAEVRLPLFPGYVFVHLSVADRLQVLQMPGVVRFVTFGGHPQPLPEHQMESLRNGLACRLRMEPHPFLRVGRKVRVCRGALEGAEGILVRRKDRLRFVLSLELLMRSVAVEVDAVDIVPV
ncbi:MAG: UpxY family transcription antiterminator [Candidatus Korobacteraceae bacterium]